MWRFEWKKFGVAISSSILKITTQIFFKFSELNVSTCKTENRHFPPKIRQLQVSNAKTKEFFFQKKSWSQMIPNRLIRREMQKKNFFGGSGNRRWTAEAAVPPPFFMKDTKTLGNYWLNHKILSNYL